MRFHFHFLDDAAAVRALSGGEAPQLAGRSQEEQEGGASSNALAEVLTPTGEAAGRLDALLADEGLDLAFPEQRRRGTRRRQARRREVERVDDSDVRSLRRLATRSLFLLVRYGSAASWTFPKADRSHGQPMRETLLRLCERQLGAKFEPYVVGASPFSYRKLRSELHPGISGRKVFYYRARLVPGMDVALPGDSPVVDWAWCARQELPLRLGAGEWCAVRDCLPLDDMS